MDIERVNRGPLKNSGAEPFSALRDERAAQLALRPFTKTSTAMMDVSPFYVLLLHGAAIRCSFIGLSVLGSEMLYSCYFLC